MRVQQLTQSARTRAMTLKARATQKYYSGMEALVKEWYKNEIAQARAEERQRFLAMEESYRKGLVDGYNQGLIKAKARIEAGEEIQFAKRAVFPEDDEEISLARSTDIGPLPGPG